MADIYLAISGGAACSFAQPDALKVSVYLQALFDVRENSVKKI